jgi:hypothetical protein
MRSWTTLVRMSLPENTPALVVLVLAFALWGMAEAAAAPPPPYLVLRTPVQDPSAPAHPGVHAGRAIPVARHTYAYGWFGAAPRRHAARHHGYRRQYIQWSWQ